MVSFVRQTATWPWFVTALVLGLALARPAAAQEQAPRYDPAWHSGLAAASVAGSALMRWADPRDQVACRWCGGTGESARAPRLDEWAWSHVRWVSTRRANAISHVTAGAAWAWPLAGLTAVHGGTGGEWGRDQLAALSSLTVAQVTTDAAKRLFGRSRPGIVFSGERIDDPDDVHSFFSGHTATAFAAVVATGTIASRRDNGDAGWIWAAGLGLAGTTGYMRVAAGRHFLTDVLAGAAVGTTIGALLPRLFDDNHRDAEPAAAAVPIIVGLGPTARLAVSGRVPVTLQLGGGARTVGLIGTLTVP